MPFDSAAALSLPTFPPTGPALTARGVGCWRLRHDGSPWPGLPAAIAAVRRAHPGRLDLQRLAWLLLPRLPGLPLASDSLKTATATSGPAPMETIVASHAWFGPNTSEAVNVVWVDADHRRWKTLLARAVAAGLPRPAWTAASARGAHLVWILRTPAVLRLGGDLAQVGRLGRKLSVTVNYLVRAIEGDQAAALRGLMKNPFAADGDGQSRWEVEVGDVEAVNLDDLLRPLEALAKAEGWEAPKLQRRRREFDPDDAPKGRRLWDTARHAVYDAGTADLAEITGIVDQVATQLGSPAPVRQRRGMARRLARFMATRWKGTRRRVLAPAQVAAARAEAGRATAAARAVDRDDRISSALADLIERGLPVTKAAVAELAECSERTVARSSTWQQHRGGGVVRGVTHAPTPSGSSPLSTSSFPCFPSSGAPAGMLPPRPELPACLRRQPTRTAVAAVPPRPLPPLPPQPSRPPGNWRQLVRWRARLRAEERAAWHQAAAELGPEDYQAAFQERLANLAEQRLADLRSVPQGPDGVWLQWFTPDPHRDIQEAAYLHERRQQLAMGWAARLKAEERQAARAR